MPSQIINTTTLAILVAIAAMLLSEQIPILKAYTDVIVSLLRDTIWNNLLKRGDTVASCRIAQFGALVILRRFYTEIVRPMYLIMSTVNNDHITNLKSKYGSWGVIVGDLDLGNVHLMREFARDLISRGINILILDCSSVGGADGEKESVEKMRNEVVEIFINDLRQYASKRSYGDGYDYPSDNENGAQNSEKNESPQIDILLLKDGTLSSFCSKITAKLGHIAQDGGIGFLVHCFSSKQVTLKHSKNYTPSCKKYGIDKFLTVLNLTLPYMIFKGNGAIINVSSEDHDGPNVFKSKSNNSNNSCDVSFKARGVAECAFYTQLIRSIHYEYGEYGIDSLGISMSTSKGSYYQPDVVVRSSLCMLGEEYSELDLKICRYVNLLKSFLLPPNE